MIRFRNTHSREIDGQRHVWDVERLWELSAELPVKSVPVASIRELDMDVWFCGKLPTIREVAQHCRRIREARLNLPIILHSDGTLMDGGHRVARALIDGLESILAVQFATGPDADAIEPAPPPSA